MMWVSILKTFLDGAAKYHGGELRCVDDESGARFVSRNWASKVDAPAVSDQVVKAEPVTLNVHKSTLGVKVRKHG